MAVEASLDVEARGIRLCRGNHGEEGGPKKRLQTNQNGMKTTDSRSKLGAPSTLPPSPDLGVMVDLNVATTRREASFSSVLSTRRHIERHARPETQGPPATPGPYDGGLDAAEVHSPRLWLI
ncbi:hypothetical protein Cob_v000743 [Colletotrichum orbiculare MAFF 240422]|uniref:Uncharacterized protein n=1 Tax=Colletotrichum orbiculare (strain 104-T / ATCC 96160 / CBS 514.97 / LARS 414 / MAFF 240422) TaxID=1213857 RepID=A0A484G8B3_COLOR|nr:hypothetical protein Cob_v000743 [Colletotrichum orbiculare MAFF 240422]